jgi:dTDP-4-amino-4,6-dideoxygalactose transaminase
VKRIEFGHLEIGDIAKAHISDCLDRNWISMGPKVELLEQEFAKLMGCKYAVATSSGTSSLVAMTLALPEISKRKVVRGKSKVICPALGFIANSTAIVSGRLIPKWVDIRPDTLNLNEDLVEAAIDDDVVAIYAIGTMGLPANLPRLREIADKYDLILFEDGCENYGSKINGEFSHSYAIGGCSSLFQAHLVQAGEGSLLFTDNEKLKDLIVSIRSHGRIPNSAYFDHIRFGSNFKMTDLCASVALEGVANFHENIIARKKIWCDLVAHSKQYSDLAWFSNEPDGVEVMPHGFSITVKPQLLGVVIGRTCSHKLISRLIEIFDDFNVHWKRNFGAVYNHPALSDFNHDKCYNAQWCGNNGIHVGTHRYMSNDDVARIKHCLDIFFKE